MRITAQTRSVLEVLLRDQSEWRYGYDLSREAGLMSGTLYPILIRLADEGWLEHEWQLQAESKPRHMYRLTAKGRREARLAVSAGEARPIRLRKATAKA